MPESFKVLIKELQSLALDVKILSKDEQEIEIKELEEDDDPHVHVEKMVYLTSGGSGEDGEG